MSSQLSNRSRAVLCCYCVSGADCLTVVVSRVIAGISSASGFRIPRTLFDILQYVGDGQAFFDEIRNEWRLVDGKNMMGRFDTHPSTGTSMQHAYLLMIGYHTCVLGCKRRLS